MKHPVSLKKRQSFWIWTPRNACTWHALWSWPETQLDIHVQESDYYLCVLHRLLCLHLYSQTSYSEIFQIYVWQPQTRKLSEREEEDFACVERCHCCPKQGSLVLVHSSFPRKHQKQVAEDVHTCICRKYLFSVSHPPMRHFECRHCWASPGVRIGLAQNGGGAAATGHSVHPSLEQISRNNSRTKATHHLYGLHSGCDCLGFDCSGLHHGDSYFMTSNLLRCYIALILFSEHIFEYTLIARKGVYNSIRSPRKLCPRIRWYPCAQNHFAWSKTTVSISMPPVL